MKRQCSKEELQMAKKLSKIMNNVCLHEPSENASQNNPDVIHSLPLRYEECGIRCWQTVDTGRGFIQCGQSRSAAARPLWESVWSL